MRKLVLAVLACLFLPAATPKAQAPLVADLSKHLVAITTGFAGTDVLLFGAVDSPSDVVMVVRGPNQDQAVRRKERLGGIWINASRAVFSNVPSFYRVASTRPLTEIASPSVLDRHQIGLPNLDLPIVSTDEPGLREEFRNALLRLKVRFNLYGEDTGGIAFLGGRLFRSEVHLPANVPTGAYTVEVYQLSQGEVVSAQTTPLIISKSGVGAEVFDFAQNQSAIYGIIAIALAAFAGWLAAVAFKKG